MKTLLFVVGLCVLATVNSISVKFTLSSFCPKLPPDAVGTCVDDCSDDSSCSEGMKCCSNGCGHTCKPSVGLPYYVDLPLVDGAAPTSSLCTVIVEDLGSLHLLGRYVPQCDEDGNFSHQQSWASPGLSWCVDVVSGQPVSHVPCEGETNVGDEDTSDVDGDHSDTSDGDHSDTSDGDHSDTSDGDHSDTSDGDHSDTSDGDRSDTSDGDHSKNQHGDGHKGDDKHGHHGDGKYGHHGDGKHGHHGEGNKDEGDKDAVPGVDDGELIIDDWLLDDDDDDEIGWWQYILLGSAGVMVLLVFVAGLLVIVMVTLIKKNRSFAHKRLPVDTEENDDDDVVAVKNSIVMESLGEEHKPTQA